jgi:hypothetical protein
MTDDIEAVRVRSTTTLLSVWDWLVLSWQPFTMSRSWFNGNWKQQTASNAP